MAAIEILRTLNTDALRTWEVRGTSEIDDQDLKVDDSHIGVLCTTSIWFCKCIVPLKVASHREWGYAIGWPPGRWRRCLQWKCVFSLARLAKSNKRFTAGRSASSGEVFARGIQVERSSNGFDTLLRFCSGFDTLLRFWHPVLSWKFLRFKLSISTKWLSRSEVLLIPVDAACEVSIAWTRKSSSILNTKA